MTLSPTVKEPSPMAQSKSHKKKPETCVLALPTSNTSNGRLEQSDVCDVVSKPTIMRSRVRQWYCSEPRPRVQPHSGASTSITSTNVDMRRPRSISVWPPFGASRTKQPTPVF